MTQTYDMRATDMPHEMQALLAQYPRESWDAHPGFRAKTMQWLNAHRGFRQMARTIVSDTESFLDDNLDESVFAPRLSSYGGRLVGNLHGHHGWEDYEYFPELSAADARFDAGLEILEKDHADLDVVLDDFTRLGNRTLQLLQLDGPAARDEAGQMLGAAVAIETFLSRHLTDEEELAVPIILHHRLRG